MNNALATWWWRRCAVYLVGLGCLLLHSAPSRAESQAPPPARVDLVVATSLVTPLFGAYYLESSIRLASRWGLVLNASRLTLTRDEWTTTANTLGAGISYYFQGDALRHWYVEAIGEVWLNSRHHEPSGKTAAAAFGGAGLASVGYRFVHPLGPVVDFGLGVVVVRVPGASLATGTGEVSTSSQTLVFPTPNVNVGWAF